MANRAQPFNARALQRLGVPPLQSGCDGRGITIGFVDYGFDLLHPCLRCPITGRTRFQHLWDQNSGRSFERTAIDGLIQLAERTGNRQPADAVYDPHASYFARGGVQSGAHGTVITSIAAGTAVAGFRGVAPAADLIGVQLGLLDHHWKEEDAAGAPTWTRWQPASQPVWTGWRNYDVAPQILAAIEHIYTHASRRRAPGLVINLSIGAYAGAHDGRSAVERKIAEIIQRGARGDGPPCAVVISAGNAGVEEGHFSGETEPDHPLAFSWRMNRDDASQNKLEIWYRASTPLELSVAQRGAAGKAFSLDLTPGPTHTISIGDVRIGIADHVPSAHGGLSRARILVHPPYIPQHRWHPHTGELSFEIRCAHRSERALLHAWIERDDGLSNRSTLHPNHPASTLSCIAAAKGALVVAAYDHQLDGEDLAIFPPSSLGPAPWGEHCAVPAQFAAAPGHRIWGARSKTAGFVETSGTSAAAALASGVVALLMQELIASGQRPDAHRIADLLIAPEQRRPWSPRFGRGAISIAHIFKEVTA